MGLKGVVELSPIWLLKCGLLEWGTFGGHKITQSCVYGERNACHFEDHENSLWG